MDGFRLRPARAASIGLPMTDRSAETELRRLLDIMAALRDPTTGCPWDREQSFATIAPYTIEEAYEVADAIAGATSAPCPTNSATCCFRWSITPAWRRKKPLWVRRCGARHFRQDGAPPSARVRRRRGRSAGAQSLAWEAQKSAERAARADTGTLAGVPDLPALARAAKLTARAARVGFDWPDAAAVLDKLDEETAELRAELPAADPARLADEVGDLLFVLANLARKLSLDPEDCLRQANRKFTQRFAAMEQHAAVAGKMLSEMSLDEMEALWQDVKRDQRANRTGGG